MQKWFNSQSRIIQILLLLIPFVNWITEFLVRWDKALKTKNLFDIVIAVLVTIFGVAYGWIDLICVILTKHLLFA